MMNDEEEIVISSFEYVKNIMDDKIDQICNAVWATEDPILYLTGDNNFRNDIAKTKPYKGNRKSEKPFHYRNLKAYIKHAYNAIVADGMEADDAMTIEQCSRLGRLDTIICSRDKDLRICPGMHYGWEVSNQDSFPPQRVSELGSFWESSSGRIHGTGLRFFYFQLIVGDSTDNIPGLPRGGPVKAYNVLKDCDTEEDMFNVVSKLYREKLGERWEEYMLEQGRLLWMVRELDKEGKPIMWEIPYA